ncbi:GAF domain-containing protein [Derxia lacustris]|uniref:GAF domain-containing protein n=1 Tax=Derxia lacustris TaxID=764842 RepID=UPI000A16EF17|nr:GAF domain-containing protein [Derxia lacustris]
MPPQLTTQVSAPPAQPALADEQLHRALDALDAAAPDRQLEVLVVLCQAAGFAGLAVVRADGDGRLRLTGGVQLDADSEARGRGWSPGQGLPGRVFVTGQPAVLDGERAAEELAAAPRLFASAPGDDRLLAVPIRQRGQVTGSLVALRRGVAPGTLAVDDLRMLAQVAPTLARAV